MDSEINELINDVRIIIDNCLDNLNEDALTEIKNKTADLIEQEMFWLKEENPKRFVYELKKFLTWLVDYVEMKDNEFWGEDCEDDKLI